MHVANGPRPAPPVAQCEGKTAYASPALAGAVLVRMARGRRAAKGHAGIYRCPHCSQWHIGQSIGPRRMR